MVLPLFVLGTTPEGTRAALRAASLRVHAGSRVVLLIPCLTRPRDDTRPADDSRALIKQYRSMALEVCPTAAVYVFVCRHPDDAFASFLTGPATVVIGGRRRVWWRPTEEQRLARRLARRGHAVQFEEEAS